MKEIAKIAGIAKIAEIESETFGKRGLNFDEKSIERNGTKS
jgi:hypothetical protein